MLKKIVLLSCILLTTFMGWAQADTLQVKKNNLLISGSVDVYYKYDFAQTQANSFTSFTQTHNRFALGMASIKVEHTSNKVNAVADLGIGQRAKDFSYNDEGIVQAIKQLYISYAPIKKLKFTVGTWASHVGYEMLDASLNRNYSMSYMFTNGPFSHTGIKAEYALAQHGFMIGIANATDYRLPPENRINRKALVAQYAYYPSASFKCYLNYVGSQSPLDSSTSKQIDGIIVAQVSHSFSLGFNGTYASVQKWSGVQHVAGKAWWGSALYINYEANPWLGLTWRSELFNDHNHLKSLGNATAGDHIFANTLSANFKKNGFVFIPEIRLDHVNKKGLFHNTDQTLSANDFNFLLAAIYSF